MFKYHPSIWKLLKINTIMATRCQINKTATHSIYLNQKIFFLKRKVNKVHIINLAVKRNIFCTSYYLTYFDTLCLSLSSLLLLLHFFFFFFIIFFPILSLSIWVPTIKSNINSTPLIVKMCIIVIIISLSEFNKILN